MKNRPDWSDCDAYSFTQSLTREQWAWEFLRRNDDYIRDYAWFIQTWQELEKDYGKPPNRDFQRWKKDPRAYRSAKELEHAYESTDCAGEDDGTMLLIECCMGARWGFYMFPQDPGLSAAQLAEPICWHPCEPAVEVLSGSDSASDDYQLDLRFDLSLPLKSQLDKARQILGARRKTIKSQLQSSINNSIVLWTRCLRLLDGKNQGAADEKLHTIYRQYTVTPGVFKSECETAEFLCQKGYQRIIALPAG